MKKYKIISSGCLAQAGFWAVASVALFVYLQKIGVYHFYYAEQEQLFLFDGDYVASLISEPGGVARLVAEFLIQFFVFKYVGALISSLLLIAIGIVTAGVLKKICRSQRLTPLSILPIITLLYLHFDINYYYSGTVAYLMMALCLNGYFSLHNSLKIRFLYAIAVSVCLYIAAGPVALLFAVCILVYELLTCFKKAYFALLTVLAVTVLGWLGVYFTFTENCKMAFLPDIYFIAKLPPPATIYYSWACMVLLVVAACLFRRINAVSMTQKVILYGFQAVCAVVLMVYAVKQNIQPRTDFFKELNSYMQHEQWDEITAGCRGELKNYLYISCLNVALAEKNELGDRLFAYDQRGVQGIMLPMSIGKAAHALLLMSDVYFSMGHIALAQRMAFEANISALGVGKPHSLKRLIRTNLIFGNYSVAEKYISWMEHTLFYKSWAATQRRFLYNDAAVNADQLLGMKRRCIPSANTLSELYGITNDLLIIAEQNPQHTATIQYAGALCLLAKMIPDFKTLIEKYYATPVLPVLPRSFQEAVIIIAEQDVDYWKRFDIQEDIINRYSQFRNSVMANRNNPNALPSLLKRSFGDTYWYYYMFASNSINK